MKRKTWPLFGRLIVHAAAGFLAVLGYMTLPNVGAEWPLVFLAGTGIGFTAIGVGLVLRPPVKPKVRIAVLTTALICATLTLTLTGKPVVPIVRTLFTLVRAGALFLFFFITVNGYRKMDIPTKILFGLVLGAGAGFIFGAPVVEIRPLGTLFIRLIQMVVIPLVFASLLVGTASLGDVKKMGRVGLKTGLYFLVYTMLSVALGLVLANVVKPGSGISPEVQSRLMHEGTLKIDLSTSEIAKKSNPIDTLINLVPTNPMAAIGQGDLLQIIVFAIFLGAALTVLPKSRAAPVLAFFEGINDAMIRMVMTVIRLAPYGVFALIAAVVASFGTDILLSLLKYSLITIAGILIICASYPITVRLFTGMSPLAFEKGIFPAQLIAFSTSSSNATLPVNLQVTQEKLGVPRDIASFVLPLGATMNMNGTALYQGVSAVFISQVYGLHLSIGDQLTIVLTATLAAVGTAGAPGVGMLMLVIVLKQVGIPVEGISLIIGVERILDMFRTVANITGDSSAAVVVAHSEGEWKPPKQSKTKS